MASWEAPGACLLGVFNVSANTGSVGVPLPDGTYDDVLNSGTVEVRGGEVTIPTVAAILRYTEPVNPRWFFSTLLDLHIHRDSP